MVILLQLNSDYPTLFANPFRSADSADLMPVTPLPISAQERTRPGHAAARRYASAIRAPKRCSFPMRRVNASVSHPYRNQDRNSHFRFHSLARLSNLTSHHSNVFAVWITVGFFEVEPNIPAGSARYSACRRSSASGRIPLEGRIGHRHGLDQAAPRVLHDRSQPARGIHTG